MASQSGDPSAYLSFSFSLLLSAPLPLFAHCRLCLYGSLSLRRSLQASLCTLLSFSLPRLSLTKLIFALFLSLTASNCIGLETTTNSQAASQIALPASTAHVAKYFNLRCLLRPFTQVEESNPFLRNNCTFLSSVSQLAAVIAA